MKRPKFPQTDFGMYTPEGNEAVTYMMEDLLDTMVPIGDGLEPIVELFTRAIKRVEKNFPEVTDTEVREMIGYYLDRNVRKGFLEELQDAGLYL